jgi:hypothetical protein
VNNPILPEAEDFHPEQLAASPPNSLPHNGFDLSSWHSFLTP